ncbi:MAG: branched-chain amino acid transaminase [Acidobacteriota bacterium]
MYDTTHFPNAKKYWHNGRFYDWSEAHLHPMTFALHYGGSVFEGIRAYRTPKGPAIFRLPEHIDRLFHSASVARMDVPYTKEDIAEAIKLTLGQNKLQAAYIRPLLFYSYGNLGLRPTHCPVELVIGTWEWGAYLGDKTEKGASVYIHPRRRIHHSQMDLTAKLGGLYVQSTICALEARSLGFDEAVFLNLEGNIAEGSGENIFVFRDDILKTNDQTESILEGITRTSILEMAKDLGYKTVVGPISRDEFFGAGEAFFTGTACEVVPITQVADGSNAGAPKKEYTIGSGRVGETTFRLRKMFKEIVGGNTQKYEKWLTYVRS